MDYLDLHFSEIDSTNNYLKNSYKLLNDFTFVSADYQNQGKGREDRIWLSEKGANLLFSFLIKNKTLMDNAPILSIVTACEIAKMLEDNGVKNVSIKWPNDVLVNDKKICGVLLQGQIPDYLIIGVGLNINQKKFDNNLRRPATSMANELKKDINIDAIKDNLYKDIFTNLRCLNKNDYYNFFDQHNYLLNKRVRVMINGQPFIGEVTGIDNNFNLQMVCKDMLIHIDSGEVDVL